MSASTVIAFLAGVVVVAAITALIAWDRQRDSLGEVEQKAESAGYFAKRAAEADVRGEDNAKLGVGEVVCWHYADDFYGHPYRAEVAGRQIEDGKVRYIRFKNVVAWGGSQHMKPLHDEPLILSVRGFQQSPCPVVEIEGEP